MKEPFIKTVGLFIDASNLYHDCKRCGFGRINFLKLRESLVGRDILIHSRIYNGLDPQSDNYEAAKKFIDFLEKNFFVVVTKEVEDSFSSGNVFRKCNFDVELAMDLTQIIMERIGIPDKIILISGDADLVAIVNAVKNVGTHVEIVSSRGSLAPQLQACADSIVFLEDFYEKIRLSEDRN